MDKLPMSDFFYDWLDLCPVQWLRLEYDNKQKKSTYTFIEDEYIEEG